MIVTYRYRLLPTKRQHRALEQILESQRQLYNAALEERIDAYRKARVTRTYIDQTKAPVGALIRSCTFKRDTKGWSVSFAVAIEAAAPRQSRRAVGVDLGITTFAALSDGGFIPSLKAARKAERRLRVAQRALSRKGLARGALAKDVHDASWARFISMLRYKAEKAGARLIEVDPHNTSQECSGCGTLVPKDLADRHHDCPHCGSSLDRDLNAARNILNRAGVGPGLRNVAGCGKRAGENLDSAPPRRQESVASN